MSGSEAANPPLQSSKVFLTGGTGYIGRHFIEELRQNKLEIYALTRRASEPKSVPGCHVVLGNALDRKSYRKKLKSVDTFVHLVGVSHPGPLKAALFRSVDLKSVQEAVAAAVETGIRHFVYVSVAHPAPVMKAYWQIRQRCETIIKESGLDATVIRPWYVLGPGHRWPCALWPLYWLFGKIPSTAETSKRLGLVSLREMISTLSFSIATPARGFRIIDVPGIKEIAANTT